MSHVIRVSARWLFLSAGIYLLISASAFCQNEASDLNAEQQAHVEWMNQFWVFLESSEYAQFRIAAAIYLLYKDDPDSTLRGRELMDEVFSQPNPDVVSLWQLAAYCQPQSFESWCKTGEAYKLLLEKDPQNAAVILMNHDFSQDIEANRKLIQRAAKADRYDVYWGRGAYRIYEDAYEFVNNSPMDVPLETSVGVKVRDVPQESYAFYTGLTMALSVMTASAYSSTINFCRDQAKQKHNNSKTINACKSLARLMRTEGYSFTTRSIGFAMERVMLEEIDAGDPGIDRLKLQQEAFKIASTCYTANWQVDHEILLSDNNEMMMNWARNVDSYGEWEASKLSAIQVYSHYPDAFSLNPSVCDKLLELNVNELERIFEGRTSTEVWLAMKTEQFGLFDQIN